jgi:undecaprenyl-diphosphatase
VVALTISRRSRPAGYNRGGDGERMYLLDQAWFLHLNGLPVAAPVLGALAVGAAEYGIVLYPLLLLGLWRWGSGEPERRRRVLLLSVVAAVLALGVNAVLNAALPRPRPFLVLPVHLLVMSPPRDSSFPSDHAAVASAIAVTLLVGAGAGWGVLGLLGAVIIGVSRVIIGVHYPSDILGGMLVGAVSAGVALWAEAPLRPVLDFVIGVARRFRLAE